MPVSRWSIKIIQLNANTVTFQPDVTGATQGQPLGVNTGDNITWNNMTNYELKLQMSPPPNIFENISLQPGSASNPIFNVTQPTGTTITYSCIAVQQPNQPPPPQITVVPGPAQIVVGSSTRPKNGGRPKGGGGRPKGGSRPK